jgi:hypothetical protein
LLKAEANGKSRAQNSVVQKNLSMYENRVGDLVGAGQTSTNPSFQPSHFQTFQKHQSGITGLTSGSPHRPKTSGDDTQYNELKKKLLNEYKKQQQKHAGQQEDHPEERAEKGSHNQHSLSHHQIQQIIERKNQQVIEDSLGQVNTGSNLNNSSTSAHLNVYKPTFIINNSYPTGQQHSESGGRQVEIPPKGLSREHLDDSSHNSQKRSQKVQQPSEAVGSISKQINDPQSL